MYNHRIRFLFVLVCIIALCSAAQATNLLITVQDSLDNTTVPHATVYLSGANVGMTNNAGQFLLQSGQGDLNLRISMDGYDDWANTVSGNVTSLSVTLNRRTLVLNVALFDSNTLERGIRGNTVFNVSQFYPDPDFGCNGCSVVRGNLLYVLFPQYHGTELPASQRDD